MFDDDALAFDVPRLTQSLEERFLERRREDEEPDSRHLPRLLSLDGERRWEHTESENDESDQPHAAGESSRTPRDAPAPRPRAPGRRGVALRWCGLRGSREPA